MFNLVKIQLLIIIIFYCGNSIDLFCQSTSQLDSLNQLAIRYKDKNRDSAKIIVANVILLCQKHRFDTTLAEAYRIKSTLLDVNKSDSARMLLKLSEALFFKNNNPLGQIKVLNNLALLEGNLGNHSLATKYYQQVISKARINNSIGIQIGALINFSDLKVRMKNYKSALTDLEHAQELAANNKLDKYDRYILAGMGSILFHMEQYPRSIYYYHLAREKYKIDKSITPIYNSLGAAYLMLDSLDKADLYLDSVIMVKPKGSSLLSTFQNKTSIAIKRKDKQMFDSYLQKFDSLAIATGSFEFSCFTETQKAMYYFEVKDFRRFEEIALRNYDCLRKIKNRTDAFEIAKKMIDVKLKAPYNKVFQELIHFSDSLATKATYQEINRFELDLVGELNNVENERLRLTEIQKESENTILKTQQKLTTEKVVAQKNYLLGGAAVLILLSSLLVLLVKQSRQRKKSNEVLSHQRDQIALLNRELNHRVKNNLAFMSSLLEMQGRRSQSEEAKQVLRESESRLRALSLVHTQLVSNNENKTINLKTYLESILSHLQNIFEIPGKTLEIHANLVDHTIDAEAAMRIGLILNELVTNSVKHAFDDVASPTIHIRTILRSEKLELSYRDNGPGTQYFTFPDQAAVGSTTSMGQKLLELLLRQLGGTPVVADGAFVVELAV